MMLRTVRTPSCPWRRSPKRTTPNGPRSKNFLPPKIFACKPVRSFIPGFRFYSFPHRLLSSRLTSYIYSFLQLLCAHMSLSW
jgi:hypothetical protein